LPPEKLSESYIAKGIMKKRTNLNIRQVKVLVDETLRRVSVRVDHQQGTVNSFGRLSS